MLVLVIIHPPCFFTSLFFFLGFFGSFAGRRQQRGGGVGCSAAIKPYMDMVTDRLVNRLHIPTQRSSVSLDFTNNMKESMPGQASFLFMNQSNYLPT